jgi:thioredoxin 1
LQFFEITVPASGVAAPGFPFLVSEPELDHINRADTFVPVTKQIEIWRMNVSEKITHVTDGSFDQEVLNAKGPVLVDYWAEWCGPCKMIGPIVEEIAEEYGDKLKVTKLDIDSNNMTPRQYGIRGIPTLMIFRDGKVQATKVGALTKGQLKAFVDEVV